MCDVDNGSIPKSTLSIDDIDEHLDPVLREIAAHHLLCAVNVRGINNYNSIKDILQDAKYSIDYEEEFLYVNPSSCGTIFKVQNADNYTMKRLVEFAEKSNGKVKVHVDEDFVPTLDKILGSDPKPKPPIGIMPRDIYIRKCARQRLEDITQAIARFIAVDVDVPEEWIEEWIEIKRMY